MKINAETLVVRQREEDSGDGMQRERKRERQRKPLGEDPNVTKI